jgi:hypothetical protein
MARSSWNRWCRFFERSGKAGRGRLTGRPRSTRLVVEPLEARTLLSTNNPVANADFANTDGTHPVVINVLANDNAVTRLNPGSVHVQTAPANGSATVGSDGEITYQAAAGFGGTDTFTYTVQDGDGASSNAATVSVVVYRPTAYPDSRDTDAGNPVSIPVLENDFSPAGAPAFNPASVAVVPGSGPQHGTAVANSDGSITYTPVDGFSGTDLFQYTVADTGGTVSNAAYVTVVVNRPQANDDFAQTNMNTAVRVNVLDNDTDPDGPGLLIAGSVTVVAGQGPLHGGTQVNSDGSITYTPNNGFFGTDSFQYTVQDHANATSNPATVTITVANTGAVNDDSIDTDAGNPVNIPVLQNDSSPAGLNAATVQVQTAPGHGGAAVQSDGSITYTPAQGFAGTDSFTYTVENDNGVTLGPATVSVVVNRPKANDDFATTDAGNPVTINVLDNDTDPDGPNKLNVSLVAIVPGSGPSHGSVTIDSTTGAITYTPVNGFSGTDFFQYTVTDVNNAVSNPAMVNVVVNRPQANDDATFTDGSSPVTVNVLANDTDPDGNGRLDPTTVQVVPGSGPSHGTVTVNHDGTITYQAAAGFVGVDTFQYTVQDVAHAMSNPATVTLDVNVFPPTANPDTVSTVGTTAVTIPVLAADSAPTGALVPGSVVVTSGPSHGSVSINPSTGQVTYSAAAGFFGSDTFSYRVTEIHGLQSNVATVTVNVTHAPRPVVHGGRHGRGPHLTVTDALTGHVAVLTPFGKHFHGTIHVAVGDVNGDGHYEVITTAGQGHHPLLVFDGATGALLASIRVPGAGRANGLQVASADVNNDGRDDVVVRFGSGKHTQLEALSGTTGAAIPGLSAAQLEQYFASQR